MCHLNSRERMGWEEGYPKLLQRVYLQMLALSENLSFLRKKNPLKQFLLNIAVTGSRKQSPIQFVFMGENREEVAPRDSREPATQGPWSSHAGGQRDGRIAQPEQGNRDGASPTAEHPPRGAFWYMNIIKQQLCKQVAKQIRGCFRLFKLS